MIVPAIERASVAACRRWIGAECSVCAYAWTQRHRPGWAVYVAVIDALLWWWEPWHCWASHNRSNRKANAMTYRPDSEVNYLVIHYSASAIGANYTYAQLEADHIARGFREAGYHAYKPRNGPRVNGRDLSQPGRFEQGAHSLGENDRSVGYCYEGGVTSDAPNNGFDTRTPEQVRDMIDWIDEMLARFGGDGIDPAKGPVVTGHRDMPGAATQCPGFDAGAWWRGVVEKRAAEQTTTHPDPAEQPTGLLNALFRALARIFGGKS